MRPRKAPFVAAVTLTLAALSMAEIACGSTPTPQPLVPLPGFTMPPEWTPTPEFSPAAMEGWLTLTGQGIELMMPPAYEGGDPESLVAEMAEVVSQVPDLQWVADALQQNPDAYKLLTLDRQTGSTLSVTAHDVPAGVSMREYVEAIGAAVTEQVPGSSVLRTEVIPYRGGEAGWMLVELSAGEAVVRQVTYALRHGEQVWNFNYSAPVEDFSSLQPVFEQSFQTVNFTE